MKLSLNLIALALILLNYSCSKSSSSSGTTTPPVDSIAKSLKVGLVAWYPFTGNALDSSGSGNHGTPNGASLTADRFGNYNSAYYFDGTSNIVLKTAPIKKNTDYTICAWVKTNSSNRMSIISILDTPSFRTCGTSMFFETNGQVSANVWYPGMYSYNSSSILNDNNWHLIGVVDTAGKRQLFIDGIPNNSPDFQLLTQVDNSVDPRGMLTSKCNIAIIGFTFYNSETPLLFFFGVIDDIRIWNRNLSLTEMSYLYTHK